MESQVFDHFRFWHFIVVKCDFCSIFILEGNTTMFIILTFILCSTNYCFSAPTWLGEILTAYYGFSCIALFRYHLWIYRLQCFVLVKCLLCIKCNILDPTHFLVVLQRLLLAYLSSNLLFFYVECSIIWVRF